MVLRADETAAACGGRLVAGRPDARVTGFAIDSRRVRPGDVFLALRGARFDGHRFVPEALRNGAGGVVISDLSAAGRDAAAAGAPFVIAVQDTTGALQRLGRFVRRRSGARVVAITGSVGKTTTKENVATLLAGSYRVFRNAGNLNNHIGLPLSLLELRHGPEIAVVELGMNHAGEIRTLVDIAEPDVRVWTNVAEVHAEFFDSIEAIADAKAEIMEGATAAAQLVANAGDPRVMARAATFPGTVTTFGVERDADISARRVRSLGLAGMSATIESAGASVDVRTPLLGYGQVANLAAAIAVALRFDVPLELIPERAARCVPQPGRGQVVRLGRLTVVDDTYNASPVALRAALDAVGGERDCLRRVAVLGEMLELGVRSPALHEACGRAAVEAGFGVVVTVGGPPAAALAAGARAAGLPESAVATFETSAAAAGHVADIAREGDVILVKGSRGIGMDRVVERLKAER
ncbi:MAG: UDP-N-acetylmuramoyl-tripeptide--D-alanyl-D-alanine ligase [Acidobacteria bacterium]|nr:UDP-N-acetylmuramoyl-tripeptide--D-alanyl-D-alanine ligase [Acidobacteriota bacterium]